MTGTNAFCFPSCDYSLLSTPHYTACRTLSTPIPHVHRSESREDPLGAASCFQGARAGTTKCAGCLREYAISIFSQTARTGLNPLSNYRRDARDDFPSAFINSHCCSQDLRRSSTHGKRVIQAPPTKPRTKSVIGCAKQKGVMIPSCVAIETMREPTGQR